MARKTDKSTRHSEPLFRVAKRTELTGLRLAAVYAAALVAALVAGGIFLLAIGKPPLEIYAGIVKKSISNSIYFRQTVEKAVPLLITTLGILIAFKMQFWNIGGEGQVIVGAIFATFFTIYFPNLPHPILITLMLVAGFIGGGLWGLIPAYFKSKYGTNETLFTLMLNYIALYFIKFFAEGPWKDKDAGFPMIKSFDKNAWLDTVFGIHIGWIIALVLVAFVFVYLRRTKHGYEIAVVGESENTARYAGMNVRKIVMRTMFLSGAIFGVAGVVHSAGVSHQLSSGVAGGVGFTAIIIAWLSRLNPIVAVLVSLLFAILEKGCSAIQDQFGLATAVSEILQGIILFFVLGFDFFVRYRIIFADGKHGADVKEEK